MRDKEGKEVTWDSVLTNGWQFMDSFSQEKVDKYQSSPNPEKPSDKGGRRAGKRDTLFKDFRRWNLGVAVPYMAIRWLKVSSNNEKRNNKRASMHGRYFGVIRGGFFHPFLILFFSLLMLGCGTKCYGRFMPPKLGFQIDFSKRHFGN